MITVISSLAVMSLGIAYGYQWRTARANTHIDVTALNAVQTNFVCHQRFRCSCLTGNQCSHQCTAVDALHLVYLNTLILEKLSQN